MHGNLRILVNCTVYFTAYIFTACLTVPFRSKENNVGEGAAEEGYSLPIE